MDDRKMTRKEGGCRKGRESVSRKRKLGVVKTGAEDKARR